MIDKSTHGREQAVFFDIPTIGRSFQEVAVDIVRGETTEFVSRWFKASFGDADLTIWVDSEKRIVKHQMSLYGQVVEWSPIHGTRTGLIVEHEAAASAGADVEAAEIISFDKKPEKIAVDQAIKLLKHIPLLKDEERSALAFNLRESPKLHHRARERAIKAWAPHSAEIMSDVRPGFWKKLGKWVFGR